MMNRIPNTMPRASAAYAEAEQVFKPAQPRAVKHVDESSEKKKGMMPLIGAGSITLLLIIGFLGYSKMHTSTTAPKPTIAPQQQTVVNTQPQAATIATSPAQQSQTQAATPASTDTDHQRTQADMMNRQLSSPSRIPSDLKMLAGREPPPSSGFASSGLDVGGSGAPGNVFSGSNGPKVKIAAPSRLSISAGVAGGLLIQKTAPAYPQMAREARVSGTVVIQATISKTGEIQNLHVVSGPTMLRQPALDAVKTWRYKPYLLDGEPVEVETTVSVNFSLGG
jgi:protein TonB